MKSLILLLIFISFNGLADSIRCKNQLIEIGDTKTAVLQACGKPLSIKKGASYTTTELQEYKGYFYTNVVKIREEIWTYNLGLGKFLRILTFQNNTLYKIEKGDK